MASLLFGLPPGQVTPTQLDIESTPASTLPWLLETAESRLRVGEGGRIEASEAFALEQTIPAAEKSLAVLGRINETGQKTELRAWAANLAEAKAALATMRKQPAMADYTDWLTGQLDDMEVANEAPEPVGVVFIPQATPGAVARPGAVKSLIPLYEKWLARMSARPQPSRAKEFLPVARAAFAAEGLPEELVWLAETESTFNPRARSPVGARGLFQLMPDTAKSLGLSLRPYDQRLHPAKSARAAAKYLKKLHARFGDWPLAIAAYNGGESRVARTLQARRATDFAGIASHLPAETRLYVPRVLATIKVRTGLSPHQLPAPRN
jgi:membrane-bound lytic murein transglycosylase D